MKRFFLYLTLASASHNSPSESTKNTLPFGLNENQVAQSKPEPLGLADERRSRAYEAAERRRRSYEAAERRAREAGETRSSETDGKRFSKELSGDQVTVNQRGAHNHENPNSSDNDSLVSFLVGAVHSDGSTVDVTGSGTPSPASDTIFSAGTADGESIASGTIVAVDAHATASVDLDMCKTFADKHFRYQNYGFNDPIVSFERSPTTGKCLMVYVANDRGKINYSEYWYDFATWFEFDIVMKTDGVFLENASVVKVMRRSYPWSKDLPKGASFHSRTPILETRNSNGSYGHKMLPGETLVVEQRPYITSYKLSKNRQDEYILIQSPSAPFPTTMSLNEGSYKF